ncbi:hypothetical protein [Flaviflagellibacter deserti]|uniref:Uncharacterized protein n=1 Tax=Flaviflagellibacter deserti TaxID=2267266 RepID=A0ABV9YZC2_9HYPH
MAQARKPRSTIRLGTADDPDAPGPVPHPDHSSDIPAAPATHPPEPMIVPSDSAIGELWSNYGPTLIIIVVAMLVVGFLLAELG